MRQGRHEALSNRIVDDVENDRDGVGRPLSCGSNRRAAADDEVRCRTHQLCRISLDLTQIPTRVSMLDSDIAVLGPAERLETLAKCNDPSQHFGIVLGVWMQECDEPHALALLRARRKRPRCRAAEQRNEPTPSYVKHGLLPGTRCASLPQAQHAPEAPPGPWVDLNCSESRRRVAGPPQ